jgi:hypothetical protein
MLQSELPEQFDGVAADTIADTTIAAWRAGEVWNDIIRSEASACLRSGLDFDEAWATAYVRSAHEFFRIDRYRRRSMSKRKRAVRRTANAIP